jgi:hypothetical protein
LCQAHYYRLVAHGDPLAGRTAEGAPARFLQDAIRYDGNDCLPWPFAENGKGYGVIWNGKRMQLVTRIVCEARHGPAPSPLHEAAHSCGKGHESCCTPAHLHWATHQENELEKVDHGTHRKGERHPLVKLSEEEVRQIRELKGVLLQREIAELYGIKRTQVSRIHSGKRWGHIS